MKLCYLFTLVFLHTCYAAHDPKFCNITLVNDKSETIPKMPNAFWCQVAAQFRTPAGGYTLDISELVDSVNKRGSLTIESKSMQKRIIYDYRPKQAIVIDQLKDSFDDGACVVQKLADKDGNIMGGIKAADGKIVANSPSAVFQLTDVQNKEFIGKETVRGVKTNHWYSCMYDSVNDLSLIVHWYFTDPKNWTPSGQNSSLAPVRVYVKGQYNKENRVFDHMYDIYRFRSGFYRVSDYPFQIPQGYFCKDVITNVTLPLRPYTFSYSAEMIDSATGSVSYQREMYNFNSSLARIDADATTIEAQKYGAGKLSKIYDFTRGVEYIKNIKMGNCTVTVIDPDDRESSKTDDPNVVRMRNPDEFFYLDKQKPLFKGVQYARGLPVNVWMVQRSDYPGIPGVTSTFEWGFATSYVSRNSGENVAKLQPLWLQIKMSKTGGWDANTITYSYYDYSTAIPELWQFDISTCFKNHANVHYSLHFSATNDQKNYVMNHVSEFREFFSLSIVSITGITPLRITNMEPYIDDTGILVEFTINERPPVNGNVKDAIKGVLLEEAVAALDASVKKGELFLVFVMDGFFTLNADRDSFTKLESRTDRTITGYSPASMIGLGFGMLVFGFLIGLLNLYIFAEKRNGKNLTDIFNFKLFKNESGAGGSE